MKCPDCRVDLYVRPNEDRYDCTVCARAFDGKDLRLRRAKAIGDAINTLERELDAKAICDGDDRLRKVFNGPSSPCWRVDLVPREHFEAVSRLTKEPES